MRRHAQGTRAVFPPEIEPIACHFPQSEGDAAAPLSYHAKDGCPDDAVGGRPNETWPLGRGFERSQVVTDHGNNLAPEPGFEGDERLEPPTSRWRVGDRLPIPCEIEPVGGERHG